MKLESFYKIGLLTIGVLLMVILIFSDSFSDSSIIGSSTSLSDSSVIKVYNGDEITFSSVADDSWTASRAYQKAFLQIAQDYNDGLISERYNINIDGVDKQCNVEINRWNVDGDIFYFNAINCPQTLCYSCSNGVKISSLAYRLDFSDNLKIPSVEETCYSFIHSYVGYRNNIWTSDSGLVC